MRFRTIIITMKKNNKSYTTLATNKGSCKTIIINILIIASSYNFLSILTVLDGARKISPIPPPFLKP